MLLYCKNKHLKSQSNIIQHNRCKLCRYLSQRKSRQRLLKARSLIINKLKDVPCKDCKKKFPFYVMDYDHVRGIKYKDISKMTERNSWKKILDEIRKCELVCSNCHRVRTHKRRMNL